MSVQILIVKGGYKTFVLRLVYPSKMMPADKILPMWHFDKCGLPIYEIALSRCSVFINFGIFSI